MYSYSVLVQYSYMQDVSEKTARNWRFLMPFLEGFYTPHPNNLILTIGLGAVFDHVRKGMSNSKTATV